MSGTTKNTAPTARARLRKQLRFLLGKDVAGKVIGSLLGALGSLLAAALVAKYTGGSLARIVGASPHWHLVHGVDGSYDTKPFDFRCEYRVEVANIGLPIASPVNLDGALDGFEDDLLRITRGGFLYPIEISHDGLVFGVGGFTAGIFYLNKSQLNFNYFEQDRRPLHKGQLPVVAIEQRCG